MFIGAIIRGTSLYTSVATQAGQAPITLMQPQFLASDSWPILTVSNLLQYATALHGLWQQTLAYDGTSELHCSELSLSPHIYGKIYTDHIHH